MTQDLESLRQYLSQLFLKDDLKQIQTSLQNQLKTNPPTDEIIKQAFYTLKVAKGDEKLSTSFECLICKCIVYLPRECSQCHQIYCSYCINRTQFKNGYEYNYKCPNCNTEAKNDKFQLITNRNLKNQYNSLQILGCPLPACSDEGQFYTLEEIIKHLKTECKII